MRQKIEIAVLVVAFIVIAFMPSLLTAQVALDDQLKAQYNFVKMGADSSGTAVVEAARRVERELHELRERDRSVVLDGVADSVADGGLVGHVGRG